MRRFIEHAKQKARKITLGLTALAFPATIFLASGGTAGAANQAFSLVPFTVNQGNVCPGISATWDSSTGNPAPSIFLSKPCPTADFAASGVDIITPLEGQAVSNLTELNFDVKSDEWCGAGAPRFNLQLDQAGNQNAFLGCASGVTQTPTANGYTHVMFDSAVIQAAVTAAGGTANSTLQDLYIIFDEGNDLTGNGTPGITHIDNISVNNDTIGSPTTPDNKNACKNGGFANFTDQNGNTFRNQGQCVAFVNGSRRIIRQTNNNHIVINSNSNQTAITGNARVKGNTTGGNANSGGASNSNSTTNNVNVSNNPQF
jgi:hypothetical protein